MVGSIGWILAGAIGAVILLLLAWILLGLAV
jgi:hypothetical protein